MLCLVIALFSLSKSSDVPPEAYPTVDSRNAKFASASGSVCSVIERLPTSALLSAGLEKRGNLAEDSRGDTDIWRGEHGGVHVVIKALCIHLARDSGEAKKVRTKCP